MHGEELIWWKKNNKYYPVTMCTIVVYVWLQYNCTITTVEYVAVAIFEQFIKAQVAKYDKIKLPFLFDA